MPAAAHLMPGRQEAVMRKASLARLAGRIDGIFPSDFEQGEIGPDLFRHACLMGLEGMGFETSGPPISRRPIAALGRVKNRRHPAFSRVLDQF